MASDDPLIPLGDGPRIVGPHVDDGGRHRDRAGCVEHPFDELKLAPRTAAATEPGRRVAQRLGLCDETAPSVVVVPRVEPGPDAAQVERHGAVVPAAVACAGTIRSSAMRSPRRPKWYVRSTEPPGKLPSR